MTMKFRNANEITDKLVELNEGNKFEIYKFYQDRADHVKDRLWSAGTWLLTVMGVVVAIPFTASFIEFEKSFLPLKVINDIPVIALGIFGLFLCLYSWFVINEFKQHVEMLWDGADHLIGLNTDTFQVKFRSKAYLILRIGVLVFAISWIFILVNAAR